MSGFLIAEAQFDAGRLADANRTFTNLQKFTADAAAAEHDLGVIAFVQARPDDAAWYFRKAVREAPRVLASRRAVIAAELARKDSAAALAQLEPALAAWPDDPQSARARRRREGARGRQSRRADVRAGARPAVGRWRRDRRRARSLRGCRARARRDPRELPGRRARDARHARQRSRRGHAETGDDVRGSA